MGLWRIRGVLTKQERLERMRQIRRKDTSSEQRARSILPRMGDRFRLHTKDLPGGQISSSRGSAPSSRSMAVSGTATVGARSPPPQVQHRLLAGKVRSQRRSGPRNAARLRRQGWLVITVWECQVRDEERVARRLASCLEANGAGLG
ncbi:hypothetical protein OAG48_00090 [bacterium]|nr:hypothetical protein [bacterium]